VTQQPQPFPGPKTVEDSCDEIDAVLNEMVSGTVVTSPVNPNEEKRVLLLLQFFYAGF